MFAVLAGSVAACTTPRRTGTNFCRQIAKEMPAIGQPMLTADEVSAMVARYERLLERAPLTIEGDLAILTDLLRQSARLDPTNSTEVQELADAAYEANQASRHVREWVKNTCAVDIATGVSISPPRTAPATTSVPPSSTTAG